MFVGSTTTARATTIFFGDVVSGTGDITTGPIGATSPLQNSGLTCGPHPAATNLAICDMVFSTLVISGAPTAAANGSYTPLNLYEQYNANTNTLTMYGSIQGCASCSNLPGFVSATTLLTIVFSSNLTANATVSSATINPFPVVNSVTINPTLLLDLGETGPFVLTTFSAGGNADSSVGGNYRTTFGSLMLSSGVPEPGSAALLGLGLAAAIIARRVSKHHPV